MRTDRSLADRPLPGARRFFLARGRTVNPLVVRLALENARLGFELRARIEELEESRARVIEAADAERRRLERNLHDGAQQRLVGIALHLRLLQKCVRGDAAAERIAGTAASELAASLQELRELARGLHPAALDRGLAPALESLAARSTVPMSVVYDVSGRAPAPVELAAYFVAGEALANIAKYAHAERAQIRVTSRRGAIHIEITDDGVGGADPRRGSGLRGLLDRVEALHGTLRVISPAGGGTTIRAEIPCRAS